MIGRKRRSPSAVTTRSCRPLRIRHLDSRPLVHTPKLTTSGAQERINRNGHRSDLRFFGAESGQESRRRRVVCHAQGRALTAQRPGIRSRNGQFHGRPERRGEKALGPATGTDRICGVRVLTSERALRQVHNRARLNTLDRRTSGCSDDTHRPETDLVIVHAAHSPR